jgi:cell division protease FtsH
LNRFLRGLILYLLIAVLVITLANNHMSQQIKPEIITYDQYIHYVEDNEVKKAVYYSESLVVAGELRDGRQFKVQLPSFSESLTDQLVANGAAVEAVPPTETPWWLQLLPQVLTLLFFVGIFLFFINQMQGGSNKALSFGKSRAKMYNEEKSKIRFDDVAGLDEAKQELVEIVEFLKHPKRFVELGAKIPKGVLLFGPPGTGKTLLGRAVAGEAGVPFFSISGSDFVEMFVGIGASRVRDLFDNAKKNAPCIVFIDELDAVGRQRGTGLGGGHDEREQTLNQLLVEMDGFETNSGIIVMAASNRPDVLDPALLRPGRFDRKIVVDRPDLKGRVEILKIHSRNKPLADNVDLEVIAKQTPGFSGADLENLMNEAAILAARRSLRYIGMDECQEAIERVLMGPQKKNRIITKQDKEVFAYHEAGHAVVAHFLPNCDPVHKVTIIGRGNAGGYTTVLPVEERAVQTRAELEDHIPRGLGGRAAEEIKYKKEKITTGAQNDLERVTRLARKMIMEWGMSDKLGPLTFGHPYEEHVFLGRDISRERNYSEEVAAEIDKEVRQLIEKSYQRALDILTEHWDKVEEVVETLMDRETINKDEFLQIMAGEAKPQTQQPAADYADTSQPKAEEKAASDDSKSLKPGAPKVPKPAMGLE